MDAITDIIIPYLYVTIRLILIWAVLKYFLLRILSLRLLIHINPRPCRSPFRSVTPGRREIADAIFRMRSPDCDSPIAIPRLRFPGCLKAPSAAVTKQILLYPPRNFLLLIDPHTPSVISRILPARLAEDPGGFSDTTENFKLSCHIFSELSISYFTLIVFLITLFSV